MPYVFEWNPKKAAANLRDHGVSFEEATEVFGDPLSLNMPDPDHLNLKSATWFSGFRNVADC
jgi:uncharacterized DUF497 family protein